jgi:hypothetical protein
VYTFVFDAWDSFNFFVSKQHGLRLRMKIVLLVNKEWLEIACVCFTWVRALISVSLCRIFLFFEQKENKKKKGKSEEIK